MILKRRVNVENAAIVADGFSDMLNSDELRKALLGGQYRKIQQEANGYAFEQSGVWVVPAYRMNGLRLDSIEDVGVTKAQLRAFLTGHDTVSAHM